MRLIYIITLLCLLTACGGRQVAEKPDEDKLNDSSAISSITDLLVTTNESTQPMAVEDTLEFTPKAEVALYAKKFNAKTECDYWIVDLALEKDGDLTVSEPYDPIDSTKIAYTPLYKLHVTITDKRKKEDNIRNIYITREMLNNIWNIESDIFQEFDFVSGSAVSYTKDIVNLTCAMTKTGTDWVMHYGCAIGPDCLNLYLSPLPEEYYSED